jgi:hypothetical protein
MHMHHLKGRIRVPPGGHFYTWITLFNGRVPPEVIGDHSIGSQRVVAGLDYNDEYFA